MIFSKLFIEKDIQNLAQTQFIKNQLSSIPHVEIERVDEVFGQVKKPYLQKRKELQLFLGKKRGTLIKEAPPAYGGQEGKHYYFIHAYNCIYECQYCYLQGYFNSPDIVLFLNYEEITKEMLTLAQEESGQVWFHAGEFSDSLALTHLTGELDHYFNLFKKMPNAFLELRTKSSNVKPLLKFSPLENIITSFSLAPASSSKQYDLKTPSLEARLKAIAKLVENDFPIGLHLDPIIYCSTTLEDYSVLAQRISEVFLEKPYLLNYLSLGVVRFTKDVYSQVKSNYPKSSILAGEFVKSFDGKVRYPRPLRQALLKELRENLIENGIESEKIYLCME